MEQQTASTICENAYKNYVSSYLDKYHKAFDNFTIPAPTEDLVTLVKNQQLVKDELEQAKMIEVEPCTFDLRKATDAYVEATGMRRQQEEEDIERKHAQELEMLKRHHSVMEEEARASVSEEVKTVLDKRAELLTYKDKLSTVFERYAITPNEIKISSDMSIPDLCKLYDEAINMCSKYFKDTSSKIFEKLSVPVAELSESEGWILLFGMCVAVTLASPILLVIYSYKSIRNTTNLYTKLDELKLASALMYEGDFDRFVDKSKYEVADEDTTSVDKDRDDALSSLVDLNELQTEFDDYINSHLSEIQSVYNDAKESADGIKRNTISILTESYNELTKMLDEVRKGCKKFGSSVYDHFYFNRDFQIGTLGGTLPVTIKAEMKNIVFVKSSPTDTKILPFVKLMLLNALMNVKEKHLYITIVDNTDLGTHYSEFFDTRFPDIVTLETEEAAKVVEKIKTEETERIKQLKTSDIDSVNKEHEEVGKIPIDYKLYIITGDLERMYEDEAFLALMRHSARFGIWLWVVGPRLEVEDCVTYEAQPTLADSDPMIYTGEMASEVMDVYAKAYEDSKDRGIKYFENFANKYIPRDKWWTYSTKKGIDLHFGLVDGDPDKGLAITLGDAPVHGNMVGTTGAGKSVCINQLLASLITMYSPNELQLVMIDFKNVEFSFYADAETHSYSRLPHSKVLAGTKDGEYALSIFKYVCDEMNRRTAIFSEAGVKNLEEYRDKYPDAVMPRILLLIDEYQVMFTELPDKIVNKIMEAIRSLAKLARFCGAHMLFTSQSMKGTMDKDVQDQFALRVALRCSADTATAVLGDDAPSRLKSKFGYLYTNEDGANTKEHNRLWRTPFIPTGDLNNIITEINKMWGKPNLVEFYDEQRTYTDQALHDWYTKYPDVWTDPHVMILGEKTAFDVNKAPCNFRFARDDGENMLIFGQNTSDCLNIVLTMIDNIKHHEDAQIMISSADRDAVSIIDMPSLVPPNLVQAIDPSYPFSKLMDLWEKVIAARKDMAVEDLKPLYIFCVFYEKQQGYGRNTVSSILNRFEEIMTDAGQMDVHFVVVLKNKGDLMSTNFKRFNHKIVLKCDASMAFQLTADDDRPSKFPSNQEDGVFGIYTSLNDSYKFKVYLHTFANPIVSNEIFIG